MPPKPTLTSWVIAGDGSAMHDAGMKELTLAQGTIAYRDFGKGPTVLFVHGLLADGQLWLEAAELLAASGHRCIVPDWPLGSHRRPMNRDADLSPLGVARLVADFCEALDLRSVTLVGNDSGGAVSQLVASRHGERIARLVLTNCDVLEAFPPKAFAYLTVVPRVPGMMLALAKAMYHLPPLRRLPIAYGGLTVRRLPDDLLESWVEPAARNAEIRDDIAKFMLAATPELTLGAARDLRSFGRPILLLWGAADPFFTLDLAERFQREVPTAKLERVEGARTFVALDRPEAVASGVARLVARASKTPDSASESLPS
jgi:pimeloyl-ACP methyl ester carboxylesterase